MKRGVMMVCSAAVASAMMAQDCPIDFPGADAAMVGIYVAPIDSMPLIDYNAEKLFVPASTVKCVTSAACVLGLDKDFRFETDVYVSGETVDGVVQGDLVIDGVGDPTLESRHFPEHAGFVTDIVNALKMKDIDSISGQIINIDNAMPGMAYSPHWMIEDIGADYGAGLYDINYKDNAVRLTFPQGVDGDVDNSVLISPHMDELRINQSIDIGDKVSINAYPDMSSRSIMVYGTVRDSSEPVSVTCSNPAPFDALCNAIDDSVKMGYEVYDEDADLHKILSHYSPGRDEILHSMMVRSDNLYAEGMLRALVDDSVGSKTIERALAVEKMLIENVGVDMSGQQVRDGSGLSRNSWLSPLFMGQLLKQMAHDNQYVALFPVAGEEGSVKSFLKDTKLVGQVVLKSGSMGGVLCYAGYKLGNSGKPTHVIVLMANNFLCKHRVVRQAMERYLLEIF